jgi:hypothetical protein
LNQKDIAMQKEFTEKIKSKASNARSYLDDSYTSTCQKFNEINESVFNFAEASIDFGKDFADTATEKGKNIAIDGKTKILSGYEQAKIFTQEAKVATSETYRSVSKYTSVQSGALLAFLSQREILKWTNEITKEITSGKASVYDKAMDAVYNQTHIGGGYHRLFDGSHDPLSAWEKVRDALPDDSFSDEVIGYASALWKDAATKMGLPFKTIDQESFNQWADKITETIPLTNKEYVYDLLSFDALEVVSIGVGVASLIFCFRKEDQKKLWEILSSMGVVSIASANPLMALFIIGIAAYAYIVKKTKLEPSSIIKGGSVAVISCSVFTFLGLNLFFELIIVIALTSTFKNCVLENNALLNMVKEKIELARAKGDEFADQICFSYKWVPITNEVKICKPILE